MCFAIASFSGISCYISSQNFIVYFLGVLHTILGPILYKLREQMLTVKMVCPVPDYKGLYNENLTLKSSISTFLRSSLTDQFLSQCITMPKRMIQTQFLTGLSCQLDFIVTTRPVFRPKYR